jgi:anti-anti-sigma regulatory factor
MLKVTTTDQENAVTLKLEGKLAGPWVQEVNQAWQAVSESSSAPCVIDLQSITYIDRAGRALLALMSQQGARLLASGCMTRTIVDQIEREAVLSAVREF